MTGYTRRRLRMVRDTLAVLDGAPEAWRDHAPLAETVARLRDWLAETEALARRQVASNPKGLTRMKRAVRTRVNVALGTLGSIAAAGAALTGDADLAAVAGKGQRDWTRLAEADLFSAATAALAAIDARIDVLVPCGATPERVQEAHDALAALRPLTPRRDIKRAARVAATAGLATGYAALVQPLAILDALVPALVADADLAARYAIARRIIGR